MPRDYAAPVLVVQHMSPGFIGGMATWLSGVTSLRVKLAEKGEPLKNGVVYLAPDGYHLGVSSGRGDRIRLTEGPPEAGFRPSANALFRSVAEEFGRGVVAVIMTGMGRDGVDGLRSVRKAGGHVVAQSEESCVVFGMPGAAVDAGVVSVLLPLAAIVQQLESQVNGSAR